LKQINRLLSLSDDYFSTSNAVLGGLCFGFCLPLFFSDLLSVRLLLFSLFVVSALYYYSKRKVLLCLLFILLGCSWSVSSFEQHRSRQISPDHELKNILLEGEVLGLPKVRGRDSSFIFRVINSPQNELRKGDLIKLNCYRCSWAFQPNDVWQLLVRLKQPHGYASWGAFDYEKYLFHQRVVAKGYIRVKEANNYLIKAGDHGVDHFRLAIKEKLDGLDRDKSVGFAMIKALAIGDKSSMTPEQRDVFQKTGVSHLMAISGLHVGLVFIVVYFLSGYILYPFSWLYCRIPRPHLSLFPALGAAFFYSALAGFSISTQRAFTMLCVYVVCRLLVRDVSLFKVLLVSVSIVLLLNPFSILDAGFWLSCGAVFVIAQLTIMQKNMSLFKLQPKLWLGMLPMNVIFFGRVSFISPLVNLLAVPLFCVVLIPITLGAVLLFMLGFEWFGGGLLVLVSYIYGWLYQGLVVLSNIDAATAFTMQWTWFHSLLLITAGVAYYYQLRMRFMFLALLFLSIFVSPMKVVRYFSDEEVLITLLDVGQGLSMVVHIASHDYTLVYDTGPRYASGFNLADSVLLPYLRSHGINRVNRLLISHADNDHIGGFYALKKGIEVGDVLSSRTDVLPESLQCRAGQHWRVGEVEFDILSPQEATPIGSNNHSCVLRIEFSKTVFLISGDIEKQVERYLLAQAPSERAKLKADILLVPHQGSKTSSTPNFIDMVEPKLALLAAGYLNHYGHPHQSVSTRYHKRGIDLVSTIENGSITIKIGREGWQRYSYRDRERGFWHHQKKPNWD